LLEKTWLAFCTWESNC